MIKKHKLCPVKIISRASELYQKYWKEFSLILLLVIIASSLSGIGMRIDPVTGNAVRTGLGHITGILSWLLTGYISLASIRYTLKLLRGKEEKLDALFSEVHSLKQYVYFLLGKIIVGFITSLAFVFLVFLPILVIGISIKSMGGYLLFIPLIGLIISIYISLSFFLVPYLLADKEMGVFESIDQSWKMMKGKRCKIFILGVLLVLLNIIGVLALGFGILITIPITMIAGVVAYEEIQKLSHSHTHHS